MNESTPNKIAVAAAKELCQTPCYSIDEMAVIIQRHLEPLLEANESAEKDLLSLLAYCEGDICYNAQDVRNINIMVKNILLHYRAVNSKQEGENG